MTTLASSRVIFNIKGNAYRLVVKARYQNGIAQIEEDPGRAE
ncbi:MAG: type II toxin-antitoxin system HigB family toxin [Burkholderiales bacterium]